MKQVRWVAFIAVFGVISCSAIFWGLSHAFQSSFENAPQAGGKIRRKAPEFNLQDAKGVDHRLANWAGGPVLIHFWASWCPPCLPEIPEFLSLSKRYEGKPIQFVTISLDDGWQEAMKILPETSLENHSKNLTSLLDLSKKVPDEYGTFQFPETYLLNSKLEIMVKWVGPQNWKDPGLLSMIDRSLESGSATK